MEEEKKQEESPNIIRFVVRPRKDVSFAVGTIDNETMGKRKSKICCIFNKGHTLDSSSSSEDSHGDCEGHHEANRYDRYPKH